jgi:stearoyl-CoA desaturase (Delta-9 desaturase)
VNPPLNSSLEPAAPASGDEAHDDIVYPAAIPFVIVHLICLTVIWTGVTTTAVVMAFVLYFTRMWALTAGYHRYFSHRSYKTSRGFQLFMALLGQSSAQRGVVWWSAVHRHHHLHSDTPQDAHSPRHMGFFHSHVGWIFRPRRFVADYSTVSDLTKYPELMWLDRHPYLPAALLGVACYLIGGWPGLVVGFFMSTVVLYHCVFFINSLAHVVGKQRYLTGDDSRNNWWLALITLGEGWHNNHHHYQSSTAQGWRWYEVDISYYVLKVLSWLGLVWDMRAPPAHVVRGEQPIGRKVLERVAGEVAGSFSAERIAEQVRASWAQKPTLEELVQRVRATGEWTHAASEELSARTHRAIEDAQARVASLSLPHLPTAEELVGRAEEMFQGGGQQLDLVAERAREMLQEAVSRKLLEPALARG